MPTVVPAQYVQRIGSLRREDDELAELILESRRASSVNTRVPNPSG